MSTTAQSLGWASGPVTIGGNNGPEHHDGPGLAVFRMTESSPGEAAAVLPKMEAVGNGQSSLAHGDEEVRQALAIYDEVKKALSNDGRIDGKEALAIVGHALKKGSVTDLAGGFAGQLIERFLGGK